MWGGGTQCTFFASTKVLILTPERVGGGGGLVGGEVLGGFTFFTSTKVHMLTPERVWGGGGLVGEVLGGASSSVAFGVPSGVRQEVFFFKTLILRFFFLILYRRGGLWLCCIHLSIFYARVFILIIGN